MNNKNDSLDIRDILAQLPHRYPFLLVDRVLSYESGQSLLAIKNVTVNEPFFPGHFPERPVMPGVIILEALAQATGLLAFLTAKRQPDDETLYYLVGIDKARFRRPVVPGDQLHLKVEMLRHLKGIWKFQATALVDGKRVAHAEMMCAPEE